MTTKLIKSPKNNRGSGPKTITNKEMTVMILRGLGLSRPDHCCDTHWKMLVKAAIELFAVARAADNRGSELEFVLVFQGLDEVVLSVFIAGEEDILLSNDADSAIGNFVNKSDNPVAAALLICELRKAFVADQLEWQDAVA